MEERYLATLVTYLMLTRENNGKVEVLLSLRKNTGYGDDEYGLPGGHVDAGEDLMHVMARESKEELVIDVKEENLKIAHILQHYTGIVLILY